MLRRVVEADLPLLRRWRNHPDVRRVMFTDHEISAEEHQAWWSKTKDDPTRRSCLYADGQGPAGVVNYFDIDSESGTCHWGFYLDNERPAASGSPLSTWLNLEQEAIEYAFNELKVRRLVCETFAFNEAVLAVHARFGFRECGRERKDKQGQACEVVVMELLNPQPHPAQRREAIAFLGSANWELAADDFARRAQEQLAQPLDVVMLPFGQYRTALADAASELRQRDPTYCVFCERFEDLLDGPFAVFDLEQADAVAARLDEYLQLLRAARQVLSGIFLVHDLAPVRPVSRTLQDHAYADGPSVDAFVHELNQRLLRGCSELPGCHLIPLSNQIRQHGAQPASPGKYWHLGRFPYSSPFVAKLNQALLSAILALKGQTARVLVLDLDNTLWGGTVGDDGMENLRLGGDFPGSVYVEIQNAVKAIQQRGIVLALCSKNTESIALEAIRTLPAMRLREQDFLVLKINWVDKADNLRAIAEEIGVGLSALCFVDDSPYEREAVRKALPEVIVPELPQDPAEWPAFLLDLPCFASFAPTQEDKERVQRYRIRARIQAESQCFQSKEDYWRSLSMRVGFHAMRTTNQQRILQLLAKTNQFNMTTRRHTEQDLARIRASGGSVFGISLADRYSGQETVGVVILVPVADSDGLSIDSFLLSCRVLGRSVETGVLAWICHYAQRHGYRHLAGSVIPTERNQPAREVYQTHGFTRSPDGSFALELTSQAIPMPPWLEILEDIEEEPS